MIFQQHFWKAAPFFQKAPSAIIIPPHSGGYFSFGHSPNITGGAQVRFLLACQPCICYVYPALSGTKSKPPLCKGRWHFRKKMAEGL